jgi:hypothetical protein
MRKLLFALLALALIAGGLTVAHYIQPAST